MGYEYNIAFYLRLSLEDGDNIKATDKTESNSISNQRDLLNNYVRDDKELVKGMIKEFIDDGYSGTDFERPGFKKLLKLVKKNRINCIIVKDLSRFGRNYIEVGDYLEQVFPFLGIRFIAVNDRFDSKDNEGITGGIGVAFKNLLYDLYSKDLSVKVKSEVISRMRKGCYIGSRPPFGYAISKDDKSKLIIDKVAAEYVNYIFQLALAGNGTGEIARILNKEQIPTPGAYKLMSGIQVHLAERKGYWYPYHISKILQDRCYIGKMVNHKTEVKSVGGCKSRVPEEDYIICEKMQEAIISEEDFQEAHKIIKHMGVKKPHYMRKDNPLFKKVKCGCCKRNMTRVTNIKSPYYKCSASAINEHIACSSQKIECTDMEKVILNCINIQIDILVEASQFYKQKKREKPEYELLDYQKKLSQCKAEKEVLYEQYKEGSITREDFVLRREKLRSSMKKMEDKRVELMSTSNEDVSVNQITERKQKGLANKLTFDIVDSLIECIYVYDNKRIVIIWNL